ncbi:tetratricopeptide repeat protein [Streptomyces mirabilis]|uniref:tetratricopeptide repeat protein n=1 Tax=Streptomyces mirabilis TaxID=68239 RepID=UPI002255FE45|nr:hypothetical protein [Streptomyces mirabilis]MCX4612052.1 hypothetical protein [Streptomyces mirabilis]
MSHARVAPELSWFWRLLGLYGEWAATARELLAAVGAEPPAGLAEEYVLCVINALSGESGDPADQRRLARVEDVLAGLSRLLRQEQFAGRPTASEESFAPSLAGFRATGDRWGLANCLDPLGMFADWRGDHRHALELLDEGLSYVRELAAPEETSDLLRTRATVLLHQEQPVEAREHFSQALTPARTVGLADKVAVPRGAWATPLGSPETPATRACATKAPWRPAPPTGSAWGRRCASSSVSAVPRPRRGASTRRVTGPARPDLAVGSPGVREPAESAEALPVLADSPERATVPLSGAVGLRGDREGGHRHGTPRIPRLTGWAATTRCPRSGPNRPCWSRARRPP